MRQVNRFTPRLAVGSYKTYRLAAPLTSHWRKATCAEVECPHWLNGWACTVMAGSEDEAVARKSGRAFRAEAQEGGFVRFEFRAGQPCFRHTLHRVPLEREPLYVVRDGDWRGNPTGNVRRHERPEWWVEDFQGHQDRLATRLNQG